MSGRVIYKKQLPHNCKYVKLKVAYKKGDSKKRGNYRPLSMLSIVKEITEGVICRPIECHAQKQKLYSYKQWGYSEGKSTETLLLTEGKLLVHYP